MARHYAVNCSILLTELPLLDRAAAAGEAGFDAVEFWWPFTEAVPADAEVDGFARSITDAGVRLVGLNFFAGDMPGGDRGVVSQPGREQEFRDSLDVAVGLGERLGVAAFNALYGNRIEGIDPDEQDELAVARLAQTARAATAVGATVLVEPVSGVDRYPLRTAADVEAVLGRVEATGVDNVALLADLYHLAVNGDDVDAIATRAERIGHVQIADAPGRGAPGTGSLPLMRWLDDLEATGYDGWVGLEYRRATDDPFTWLPRAKRATGR